ARGHVTQYPRGSIRAPDAALGADAPGGLGVVAGGAARDAPAPGGWARHLAGGPGAPRRRPGAPGGPAAAALCASVGGRLCTASGRGTAGRGGGALAAAAGHGETDHAAAQAGYCTP